MIPAFSDTLANGTYAISSTSPILILYNTRAQDFNGQAIGSYVTGTINFQLNHTTRVFNATYSGTITLFGGVIPVSGTFHLTQ